MYAFKAFMLIDDKSSALNGPAISTRRDSRNSATETAKSGRKTLLGGEKKRKSHDAFQFKRTNVEFGARRTEKIPYGSKTRSAASDLSLKVSEIFLMFA